MSLAQQIFFSKKKRAWPHQQKGEKKSVLVCVVYKTKTKEDIISDMSDYMEKVGFTIAFLKWKFSDVNKSVLERKDKREWRSKEEQRNSGLLWKKKTEERGGLGGGILQQLLKWNEAYFGKLI